jgi:predicted aconitase
MAVPDLTMEERGMLAGDAGPGAAFAMRIVVSMAEAVGSSRLVPITRAHVDGCLYHGRASLDFAERLVDGGARMAVPTTLNVGLVDLLHPDRQRGDPEAMAAGRRLMELYVAMGCRPTWTCAPYQAADRPGLGEQIAWAESNAIVFANSVLGARTERYGDFIDACAGIAGRVPDAGLHRTEHRGGRMVFRLRGVPERLLGEDALYPVLGHLIGAETGSWIPVIEGLPPTATEDQLKALGAGAASSGSVAMFHAVGVTPEAPTLAEATRGRPPVGTVGVTMPDLVRARDQLSTVRDGRIDAVCVGTPHASVDELRRLAELVSEVDLGVPVYVNTGRDALGRVDAGRLESAGVRVVTDTCTYLAPILDPGIRVVMTNSAKWAYYAPGNIGVEVVFGSLRECVESASAGHVRRDPDLWSDG